MICLSEALLYCQMNKMMLSYRLQFQKHLFCHQNIMFTKAYAVICKLMLTKHVTF